jgi:serine/threonine protein kinase
LISRLLRWDPDERISLSEALDHAYFVGPYLSRVDGTEHATLKEMQAYDAELRRAAADAGHEINEIEVEGMCACHDAI